MKRCPQCNRVETDESLTFCRADGTARVSDSSPLGSEAGTARLGSGAVSSEIETSILPHTTDAVVRGTGPTTVLPGQASSTTGKVGITSRLRTLFSRERLPWILRGGY